MQLQLSDIDVSQVLLKSVEMASPLFEQNNHELKVDIDPGLRINGDPVRIAQAVANLLNNAARYTDRGGDITLSAKQDDEGRLQISVKDNGAGLPKEMLSKIFEMFYQAKQNIDRSQGGLGIGLALVKNIVELHDGTVEAYSSGLGYGSEFVLRMPLAISSSPSKDAQNTLPITNTAKRRILLVDDNVDALNSLGSMLEISGHDVKTFDNPIAALAALEHFKPEIAILDIGLPVVDGCELAEQMGAKLGQGVCQLIALTGYGQETDRAKSLAAGFSKHLVKPISIDKILECINSSK